MDQRSGRDDARIEQAALVIVLELTADREFAQPDSKESASPDLGLLLVPVPAATDQQVVALLPALEDAARADPNAGPIKFVPPRIGILEQTAAKRHLFVFGRRGVGKSTLLRKLQQDSDEFKSEVLFIDVETLRGRPYPDVLIELLIALLGQLDEGLRDAANARGNRAQVANFGVRRRVRRLRRTLEVLLAEPQEATRSVRRLRQTERSGAAGAVVPPHQGCLGVDTR